MSSSTIAGHLTNAQRTHDGAPVSWTASDNLDVLRPATKSFQFSTQSKYLIESSGVSYACPLGIFTPSPSHDMGSEHDACGRGVGIRLGRIAIFRACQNRKSD